MSSPGFTVSATRAVHDRHIVELNGPHQAVIPSKPFAMAGPIVTVVASLCLIVISWPAFSAFFLGEDFIYLGQFRSHANDYWRAVLSPTDGIFFRPMFAAINLIWQYILPLDPLLHHVRNYGFSIINVVLLYLLLTQLKVTLRARIIATLLFAVSKVHMTAIGYINTYDSIVSLLLLLLSALFWSRYAEAKRWADYTAALAFTFLSIFTKDYGLVVVGLVAAIVLGNLASEANWRKRLGFWVPRVLPLPLLMLAYLWTRFTIVGPLPTTNAVYTPGFSPLLAAHKIVLFTSTIGNLAFLNPETIGAPGLGSWLAGLPGLSGRVPATYPDFALYLMLLALLAATLWVGRRQRWGLLAPFVWVVVYFGPTLLTRNQQIYYYYEPLAGVAVLIAICLHRASRKMIGVWSVALVIIGMNGLISNYNALYAWQFSTNRTSEIKPSILEAHAGETLDSLTFVTRSYPFWSWALTADGQGPMLPELLKRPGLKVTFIDYADLKAALRPVDERNLLFDVDNGFVPISPAEMPASLRLRSVSPPETRPGMAFNPQPGGGSALAINAEGATRATVLNFGGRELPTIYVNSGYLTALVPDELVTEAGQYELFLTNGITESNRVGFVVAETPAPAVDDSSTTDGARGPLLLDRITPSHARVAQPFGVQPDGQSALSIDSENARSGTVVVFDQRELPTAFGNSGWLTATVPSELYHTIGQHTVYLRDGVDESNRLQFTVEE